MIRTPILVIPLVLAACKNDPSKETQATTPPDNGYIEPAVDTPLPSFSIAEIEAALTIAIEGVLTLDPLPVIDAYDSALAGGDADCPTWASFDGTLYWYSTCTSSDGTFFDGFGMSTSYADFSDGSGTVYSGSQVYTLSTITDPDDHVFKGGGWASLLWGTAGEGVSLSYGLIEAGFAWDGVEAQGTWLAAGMDPDLEMYAVDYADTGRTIWLNGAVIGLTTDVGGVEAVVFEEIYMAEESLGSDCEAEPGGSLSVLDSEGNWFDLQLDGPTADDSAALDATACDGCADVWYRGTYVGEACVDFSPWLSWANLPWI